METKSNIGFSVFPQNSRRCRKTFENNHSSRKEFSRNNTQKTEAIRKERGKCKENEKQGGVAVPWVKDRQRLEERKER